MGAIMTKFALIKQLHNPPVEEKPLLPEGIQYQEYVIEPKDGKMTVFIPLRESEEFEKSLLKQTVLLRSDVRQLLRTHRGIIG